MTEQVGISSRIVASRCYRREFVRLNVSPSRTVAFIISRNAAFLFTSSGIKCRRLEAETPYENRSIGFIGFGWPLETRYFWIIFVREIENINSGKEINEPTHISVCVSISFG